MTQPSEIVGPMAVAMWMELQKMYKRHMGYTWVKRCCNLTLR